MEKRILNIFKESGKEVLYGQYIIEHLDILTIDFNALIVKIYFGSDILILNPYEYSSDMSMDMTKNYYGLTTYYKRKLLLEELGI